MRDTSQFSGKNDSSIIDSPRRMTFYEVCLTSREEGLGGESLTELADLGEALESIYARRADQRCATHLTFGFGSGLEANFF
jgi:hypothetical protein